MWPQEYIKSGGQAETHIDRGINAWKRKGDKDTSVMQRGQIFHSLMSQVQCFTHVDVTTFGIHLGIKITPQPEEDAHI